MFDRIKEAQALGPRPTVVEKCPTCEQFQDHMVRLAQAEWDTSFKALPWWARLFARK